MNRAVLYPPPSGTALMSGLWLFLLVSLSARALEPVPSFGDLPDENPGNLLMLQHVPIGVVGPLPVVLVLHGCAQDRGYAAAAGFIDLADDLGFAVIVAETSRLNNQQGCFNWFEAGDHGVGIGEQASLLAMVERFSASHSVDADRVFVTGLSAGAAMTAVMLATAPATFAAGAAFAGVPYRCGVGQVEAFSCLSGTVTHTQSQWTALVTDVSAHGGPWPRLLAVHGSSDATVDDKNSSDLALQFSGLHGLAATPSSTSTVGDLTTRVWRDGDVDVVETVVVAGMGHGMPVDPPACGAVGAGVLWSEP